MHKRRYGWSLVVVVFFFTYFKSSIFPFEGGFPPCTPRRSAGGRPIGQEIMENQWGQFCENQLSIEKKNKTFEIFWNFSSAAAPLILTPPQSKITK